MKTKTLATICYVLCALCLIAAGLFVGAIEAETVKDFTDMILAVIAVCGFGVFAHLGYQLNHIK